MSLEISTLHLRSAHYRVVHKTAAAPQIATTTDGALVVSFYTDENDTPDSAFKIITSSTGVTGSWGDKTTVATGGASAWPGLLALADGSVLGCAGAVACHMITFS